MIADPAVQKDLQALSACRALTRIGKTMDIAEIS